MRGLYEYYINNISILYYIYIEFKKEEQKDRERFERRNCIGGKKLCREINFLSISTHLHVDPWFWYDEWSFANNVKFTQRSHEYLISCLCGNKIR